LAGLAALLAAGQEASAQVERRQLPVLQGEPAPPPPVYEPQAPAPEPEPEPGYATEPGYGVEPGSGGGPGYEPSPAPASTAPAGFPADPWQGLDAGAVQSLLQGVKLPSPSPSLAKLIARSLAAGRPKDDREAAVRAEALKQGGRAGELAELLQVPVQSFAAEAQSEGAASPMALFFLAQDEGEEAELRLAAAERAAALNIIDGRTLARAYRETAPRLPQSAQTPASLRAKLFASLDGQASAATRAESIDALLASGKDAGIEVPVAEALAATAAGLAHDPQAASFAETGIRVAALAGEGEAAWAWVDTGGTRVQSWELLLGAADPYGARARAALASGVEIAQRSRLPGPVLQRLVTVLDALGEEVPIPLWELASQSPEPQDGYLPETGVLSALKEASDRGQVGATVLLAATALGPNGPQEAHLIALGDALRALQRVGLDAEARRLALEALVRHWPAGRT
jgi:hypothetical protein